VHITLAPIWLDPAETQGKSAGEDRLSYEFVLRKDAKFHNGEPVTADDVKFSFERYRGAVQALLKERVTSVDGVVFKLKNPWPDFITFYTVASGAGWVVPKKYVEKVGEDGFKKAPIGAGPYQFVSFTPGIELVLEAFDGHWRKTPSVKRIVLRVIPDESTRLAALKNGEVDIAYSIRAELAEELQRTPGLTLWPTVGSAPYFSWPPDTRSTTTRSTRG
jgi:peptide/nickel transport system substrate-binding protein